MTGQRTSLVPTSLLAGAIGVAVVAAGVLLGFPAEPRVWQVASWTLALALLALVGLVPASGWALARYPEGRTWPRILSFALGLALLVFIGLGAR